MRRPKVPVLLRTDPVAWNAYRARNALDQDMSGCDFGDVQLSWKIERDMFAKYVRYDLDTSLAPPKPVRTDDSAPSLKRRTVHGANLSATILRGARFNQCDLSGVDFSGSDLTNADFTRARLLAANFHGATARGAVFTNAIVGETMLTDCDLRGATGLETCVHWLPSLIDFNTLRRASLPENFLRGCGLPPIVSEYVSALFETPVEKFSCFISYSNADEVFASQLHRDLLAHNIRAWFAPIEMRAGDRIRDTIDTAVAASRRLLIVLSKDSISSQYVEEEVERALEMERSSRATVLLPVRVDAAVFSQTEGWPALIRRTRHIADFTSWETLSDYQSALTKRIRDIKFAH